MSEEKVCKNCGYTVKKPVFVTPAPQKSETHDFIGRMENETLIDFWRRNNPQEKKKERNYAVVAFLFLGLAIGLGLISHFCVIKPWLNIKDQEPLEAIEMMLKYEDSITYIWVLAAGILLCMVVGFLIGGYYNLYFRCVKWLRLRKIDIDSMFQKDIFPEGINGKSSITNAHRVYYIYYTENKKIEIARAIFSLVTMFGLIGGIIIQETVEICNYIREVVESGVTEFKDDYMAILPYIIFALAMILVSFIILVVTNKKIENYLQQRRAN